MFKHGFPPEWSTLKKLIWLVGSGIAGAASGIWKTVTGTLIHITDALASPMQKCEVTLEPIQSGSGDPSPTNVRPITGWTGCNATRTGKNLQSGLEIGTYRQSLPVGTLYPDMKNTSNNRLRSINLIPIFGQAATISCDYSNYKLWYTFFGKDGKYLGINTGWKESNNTVSNSNYYYMAIAVAALDNHVMTSSDIENCHLQVELGSTATSYEPYSGTTLSVTFPDTVYGGSHEFVSGGLKPYKEYDSYNGETLTGEWMSSMDKYVAGTTPTIGAQVVDLDSYDTTVQLTPQEISTLKGENNVWGDGNIELTYKAQAS